MMMAIAGKAGEGVDDVPAVGAVSSPAMSTESSTAPTNVLTHKGASYRMRGRAS
jgi:hypothetical protein